MEAELVRTPITDEAAEKMSSETLGVVKALMPKAPEWMVAGILNTLIGMVEENGIDSLEEVYEFITERMGEVSAFVAEEDPGDAFSDLFNLILSTGWGAITVEIKSGIPVMGREYRKDIKLGTGRN